MEPASTATRSTGADGSRKARRNELVGKPYPKIAVGATMRNERPRDPSARDAARRMPPERGETGSLSVSQGARDGAKSVHTRNHSRIDIGLCTHIDEKAKFKYFIVKTKLCTPKYPVSFSSRHRIETRIRNRMCLPPNGAQIHGMLYFVWYFSRIVTRR